MQLNINTDASVVFTNKLEQMQKSALPSAIRGALNKAVFDVKKNTLQKSADASFEKRQPNFFKANSKFENAKGFDVKTMKATVGMVESSLKGSSNYAVKDLEQQESGGTIKRKSFIPLAGARISGSGSKNVRANSRLSQIKRIIESKKSPGNNSRSRFVHAILTAGVGGFVLSGNRLFRVNSLKKTNGRFMDKTALYDFKKGRSVHVSPTNFMKKASLQTAEKIEGYYILEAQRQIDKLKK